MNSNVFKEDLNLFGLQFNIAWYAVIICSGILIGAYVAYLLAKKRGYKLDVIIDFLLIALPLAVIGARLYYVFSEWGYYSAHPGEIIAIWNGGLAIYGAVIGAVAAAAIFWKWKKVPLGDVLDFGGIGLIIGQAIGRWGNFANQEAFGTAVTDPSKQWFPFAVNITKAHTVAEYSEELGEMIQVTCREPWHLATFFYESMWNLLVFAFLVYFAWKLCKRRGNVFVCYLLLYGVGRAVIEGMRTDSLWLIPGTIRISQALAIVLVAASALYLLFIRNKPLAPAYEGPYCLDYAPQEETAEEISEVFEESEEPQNFEELGEDTAEEEADAEDEKEGK